jgi:CBS domain-containing protein
MKSPIVDIGREAALGEAARAMNAQQISGLLVRDPDGSAVGVISLSDIMAYLAGLDRPAGEPGGFYRFSAPRFEEGGEGEVELSRRGDEDPLWQTTVGDVMTDDILSVEPGASVPEVAKALWDRRIHRVFVKGRAGPQGVISTMDVLGVLAAMPLARAGA